MNWPPFLLLPLLALAAGCADRNPNNLPLVKMQIGNQTYELEVATTSGTRERGLMHRDSMPSDHGMIFVFPEEQQLRFWMKHTRIGLDIVYVNAEGKVVSVAQMQPFDEKGVPSDGPAKYAIELNQGQAAKCGVKTGDKLAIPDAARNASE